MGWETGRIAKCSRIFPEDRGTGYAVGDGESAAVAMDHDLHAFRRMKICIE